MVQYYTIFGQKMASHWLSIGVLSMAFAGIGYGTSGKKVVQDSPPINAGSKDEELDFLKKNEADVKQ